MIWKITTLVGPIGLPLVSSKTDPSNQPLWSSGGYTFHGVDNIATIGIDQARLLEAVFGDGEKE